VGRHQIKLINQSDSARHTTREHLLFLIRSQQRGSKGMDLTGPLSDLPVIPLSSIETCPCRSGRLQTIGVAVDRPWPTGGSI
jgi:hypothetical protein